MQWIDTAVIKMEQISHGFEMYNTLMTSWNVQNLYGPTFYDVNSVCQKQ